MLGTRSGTKNPLAVQHLVRSQDSSGGEELARRCGRSGLLEEKITGGQGSASVVSQGRKEGIR